MRTTSRRRLGWILLAGGLVAGVGLWLGRAGIPRIRVQVDWVRPQAPEADVPEDPRLRAGIDAYARGEYTAALEAFRTVLARHPDHDMAVGYLHQTEEALQRQTPPAPDSSAAVRAAYERGLRSYRAGELHEAIRAWERAAELAPADSNVQRYLLRAYRVTGLESYTEGRLEEAIRLWEKALAYEPASPQLRRYLDRAYAKRTHTLGGGG